MAIFVRAKDRILSRLKSLTRIKRFNHTLQPQIYSAKGSDSFTHQVDVSTWKKVDARLFGITRSVIPQPSWVVLNILKMRGFQSYLVGGCVRDLLMKKIPKDFDVITTANLRQVRKQFHNSEVVGRRFPICRVHIKGSVIEVSSFETVAKHAEGTEKVMLSRTPCGCDEKDLIRWRNSMHRDFTINSLFYDPFLNKIYDYANGMGDLRSLKLRTLIPAHLSFKEDSARILRGLRIAARLGLSFSKDTETAIRKLSSSVERLDKSRIMMELNYMLSYGAAGPSICLLRRYNLLEIFLPFHAAYLDQQALKTPAENSVMLMKLLFNLDKLVSCDRPGDCGLWVGLLAFHQALVNNPQDAFVVWVFASVLYHGKWKEGVKFAREHAKDQISFAPEISGFSETKSDDELAEKVTQLAVLAQDSVNCFAERDSGLVFVSKKVGTYVSQIFDVLVNSIESYNKGRESFMIDYYLLGKGYSHETRFVLGKIILNTMSGGLVGEERGVDEEKNNHLLLDFTGKSCHQWPSWAKSNSPGGDRGVDEEKNNLQLLEFIGKRSHQRPSRAKSDICVNKNGKRGLAKLESEPKLKITKKQKLVTKKCRLSEPELTINEMEVFLKAESQQTGKENQNVVDDFQSSGGELNVSQENISEKKDCHSSSEKLINKKINIGKKVVKENSGRLPLSSLFRVL